MDVFSALTSTIVPVASMVCIYRIFELYARRKERIAMVEKSNSENIHLVGRQPSAESSSKWGSLRIGFLLTGIGLGFIVAILLLPVLTGSPIYESAEEYSAIHGELTLACILLFGGVGLLTAFLIERKDDKRKSADTK